MANYKLGGDYYGMENNPIQTNTSNPIQGNTSSPIQEPFDFNALNTSIGNLQTGIDSILTRFDTFKLGGNPGASTPGQPPTQVSPPGQPPTQVSPGFGMLGGSTFDESAPLNLLPGGSKFNESNPYDLKGIGSLFPGTQGANNIGIGSLTQGYQV
tara:strand:- start:49 stop:513 length:465 start_codon:yes stop_codon:yes gene_type:complete